MTHKNDLSPKNSASNEVQDLPLSYARTLSWLSFILILTMSLLLSVFIANSARDTLLTKQEEFANLLGTNLNHQIYQRFAVPTVLAYGRISLKNPVQYERLDTIVRSVMHGLKIERFRIYDFGKVISYSTDNEDLGRSGLAPESVGEILKGNPAKSELISSIPLWEAPLHLPLEPGSFILRTVFPLTGQIRDTEGKVTQHVMGVLELSQDITADYSAVIAFQGLIVVTCLFSSVILFVLLIMLIRRTEKALAYRVAANKALEDELHSKEKLVSMGRVIASIAHEIRNPLGIIRSSAEFLLKRQKESDTSSQRILGAIYDESCRLSQTINDFLDYARPRQPSENLVDVHRVLDEVMAFLESEFGRHQVSVEFSLDEDLYITGDKDLLYRAFYNILVNAQQAMDGPGIIHVEGKKYQEHITLNFTDTGPGFPPESIDNMFDPFFTTKDNGTGLGLAIVKSIITSHQGEIYLLNTDEGHANIRIEFESAPTDTHKG